MPATKSTPRRTPGNQPKKKPAGARSTVETAPAGDDPWYVRRAELLWASGVGLLAAILYLVTFSNDVQFGNSAETVAGVKSLGIVHAPGYVTYVIAARIFTIIEPFGSLATRVNLFGVACSVAAVVFVFRIARRIGVSRVGAAFGALVLASSLSVWFYATYAKAYGFTILLLAAVILLLVTWRSEGGAWRLYLACALVGIGSGASYQVILLAVPGFLVLVFGRDRRPVVREVVVGIGIAAVATVGVLAFVLVRAGQEPAVNWGGATSVARLEDLYRMTDFGFGTKTFGGNRIVVPSASSSSSSSGSTSTTAPASSSSSTATTQPTTTTVPSADSMTNAPPVSQTGASASITGAAIARLFLSPIRVLLFPLWTITDAGPIVAALGVLGAVLLWTRRMQHRWGLSAILLGNVIGAGAVVGGTFVNLAPPPADRVLGYGGFYLAATLVYALLAGVGAGAVVTWGAGALANERSRAARRRRDRGVGPRGTGRMVAIGALALTLALVVALNFAHADNRQPSYATEYARNVFASLPQNAVLFNWDADRAFVLEEQQIVDKERQDVVVIRIEQINRPWYRDQLGKTLGVSLGQPAGNELVEAAALATKLRATRQVYLDNAALYYVSKLNPDFGFRQLGLVAEAVDGTGKQTPDLARMDELFKHTYTFHGFEDDAARRYPNDVAMQQYTFAFLDYGTALGNAKRYDEAISAFENALVLDPGNQQAQGNIQLALQRKQQGG